MVAAGCKGLTVSLAVPCRLAPPMAVRGAQSASSPSVLQPNAAECFRQQPSEKPDGVRDCHQALG